VTPGAVFDCMVFVQALASAKGPACACYELVRGGKLTLFVSPDVIAEARNVLGRPTLRRRADIRDDPANTLMVVEATTSAINWMEPRDLEWDRMSFRLNDGSHPSISSDHCFGSYDGPHVITAGPNAQNNQVATYLSDSMSPAMIKALLIVDDGEKAVLPRGPKLD
jgi:hypothetical protein